MTTKQVENYISDQAGFDFSKVFDQYLRGTDIPVLKYSIEGSKLNYRLENVVEGFAVPAKATINGKSIPLALDGSQSTLVHEEEIKSFELDRNFYVEVEKSK